MNVTTFERETSEWARETFGKVPLGQVANRMNVEVAELLVSLDGFAAAAPGGQDQADAREHAAAECADVFIMLVQIAFGLGVDLGAEAEKKMAINRARRWETGPNGKVQHVDDAPNPVKSGPIYLESALTEPGGKPVKTFKEPGSGLRMEVDKFYILSDSGHCFTTSYQEPGFISAQHALNWARSAKGVEAGAGEAQIVTYNQELAHWPSLDGVNILKGAHLLDYWRRDPFYDDEELELRT